MTWLIQEGETQKAYINDRKLRIEINTKKSATDGYWISMFLNNRHFFRSFKSKGARNKELKRWLVKYKNS